jgi:hypothetical protein
MKYVLKKLNIEGWVPDNLKDGLSSVQCVNGLVEENLVDYTIR